MPFGGYPRHNQLVGLTIVEVFLVRNTIEPCHFSVAFKVSLRTGLNLFEPDLLLQGGREQLGRFVILTMQELDPHRLKSLVQLKPPVLPLKKTVNPETVGSTIARDSVPECRVDETKRIGRRIHDQVFWTEPHGFHTCENKSVFR